MAHTTIKTIRIGLTMALYFVNTIVYTKGLFGRNDIEYSAEYNIRWSDTVHLAHLITVDKGIEVSTRTL